jgi:hypothetical protein
LNWFNQARRLLFGAGMTKRTKLGFPLPCALALAACAGDPAVPADLDPVGPVARDAHEAWPERPALPPISIESMARACAAWTTCQLESAEPGEPVDGPLGVDWCLSALEWSAERAIPITATLISPFGDANERVEFYVDCVLAAVDCGAIDACITRREAEFQCQEDGCRALRDYVVSCDGDVATMTSEGVPAVTRDCARALAKCSPHSPTGCTDRQFTACPEPPPQPDRCDGDVRLGCDSEQQVSYRDCSRLGGSCAPESGDCQYGSDPCSEPSSCAGDQLSVCLRGARVTLEAPALCPAS